MNRRVFLKFGAAGRRGLHHRQGALGANGLHPVA
jgi:hypothetical protein